MKTKPILKGEYIMKKRWYVVTGITEEQILDWKDNIDERFNIIKMNNGEVLVMVKLNRYDAALMRHRMRRDNERMNCNFKLVQVVGI